MRAITSFRHDRRGFAAAEFALVIPLWFLLFLAMAQLTTMVFAYAGLQNGLGDGARKAAIWPRATTTQIKQSITAAQFGMQAANTPEPTITYGTAGGLDYADITVTYNSKLLLFNVNAITLRASRRVYLP